MSKSPSIRHQHVAEDILAKAAVLFDELGYGLTSLQDIADAVGIARPSLYHYFRSKEELLATLVERTTRSREEIAEDVSRMEAPPKERLSALLGRLGRATADNPVGLRLMLNNTGSLPPEMHTDGMDSGVLRPMPPRDVAALMIAALTGLQYKEIGGVRIDPVESAQMLEQMLVAGVSQPTERRAASAHDALALLRLDLGLLEHHLGRND